MTAFIEVAGAGPVGALRVGRARPWAPPTGLDASTDQGVDGARGRERWGEGSGSLVITVSPGEQPGDRDRSPFASAYLPARSPPGKDACGWTSHLTDTHGPGCGGFGGPDPSAAHDTQRFTIHSIITSRLQPVGDLTSERTLV